MKSENILAERLKLALEKKGWRVADLTRSSGISGTIISDLFLNKKQGLTSNSLEKIFSNSDISPDFLLTGRGPVLRPVAGRAGPESVIKILAEDTVSAYIQVKSILDSLAQEEKNYHPPDELVGTLIHYVSETLARNRENGQPLVDLSPMIMAQLREWLKKTGKKKAK